MHFHGWQNTVAGTLPQFKLIEQLVASGRNVVLLVPEGPQNAPDSAGGASWKKWTVFHRFIDKTLTTLQLRAGFAQTNSPPAALFFPVTVAAIG